MEILSSGDLPPNLRTITLGFDHDHGQRAHADVISFISDPYPHRAKDPIRHMSNSRRLKQRANEAAKGLRYDMMLLEILAKQAVTNAPGVRVTMEKSCLECEKCRGECERIMGELEYS